MLKSIAAIAILIALFVSNSEAGQAYDYLSISAGTLLPVTGSLKDRNGAAASLSYDSIGAAVSSSIGHQFGTGLRVEEELFYKRAATDRFEYSGKTFGINSTAWSVGAMSNLYYDWYHNFDVLSGGPFSPFLTAGIGFASVNMSKGTVNSLNVWNSDSDTALAYQLGGGCGIRITKEMMLDISYRHFKTQSIKIDQVKTSFSNQNIMLGIRYQFR